MAAKVWDLLDIVILVAWLDFCIEREITFQSDVIKLLRESRKNRAGQEYPFTMKQVEDKLIDLSRKDPGSSSWRNSKDYPRLTEIYTRGSACFPRQTNELRLQIDLALEQLQIYYPHLDHQETGRTDQSANSLDKRVVYPEEKSELRDQWIVKISFVLKGVLISPTPNIALNIMNTANPHDASVASQALAHENATISSISGKGIEIRKCYSPVKGAWKRSRTLDQQHNAVGRIERLWEEDVTSLRGHIADIEKEKDELLARLQNLDNARKEAESAGRDPKESQFRVFHQEIWTLQQLNMALESAADFFNVEAEQNRPLKAKNIDESMEQIQAELESILSNCDTTNLQINRTFERGSDLEALLISCLKLHQAPEQLDSRLQECVLKLEAPILVRAVVLAALNDWVFSTSFPPFEREGSTSLFLKSIEAIALEHRDWAWLRNLETAAYSRFLDRTEFTNGILPMKSRLLADRLTNATASLIGLVTSGTDPDDRAEAIDSILGSLHARYVKVFSAGLQFKAATAITDNRYEFVLQLPGTLAEEQSQGQAVGSPSTTRERFQMSRTRTSWFHASLKVYDTGPSNWLNPQTDAIIQTNNFVPRISKTDCPCVYQKDILIERSNIRDDSSILTMHNTSEHFGNQLSSPSLHFPFHNADTRLSPRSRMKDRLEQTLDRSLQILPQNLSNVETQQHQSSYTPAKEVVAPDCYADNDDRSQSELTDLEDLYDIDSGTSNKQAEATRSNRDSLDSRICGMRGAADAHVCRTCGASLATYDTRRRHEKNGSCRRCIICAENFRTNKALKKHQLSDHPREAKRQRLSRDGLYVNNAIAKLDNNHVCERCHREFTKNNLERHLKNKSCSKCFKCGAEFETGNEFFSHMKLSHSSEFSNGHWRNCIVENQVKESSISREVLTPNTPEETTSHLTTLDQAPATPNTSVISTLDAQDRQAIDLPKTTRNASSSQDIGTDQEATPVASNIEEHYCSICDDTFDSQWALKRHEGREHHLTRVREIKTASVCEQRGSVPSRPLAPATKAVVQDRTLQGRIEKPRSRISTDIHREPTPPTRHVTRIIASLAKFVSPSTSSAKANEQHVASMDDCTNQYVEAESAVAKTMGSNGTDKERKKAQVLIAPANFGGQFSAPPRTFENVAAGLGSFTPSQWG